MNSQENDLKINGSESVLDCLSEGGEGVAVGETHYLMLHPHPLEDCDNYFF
jgi:hypothetical protein